MPVTTRTQDDHPIFNLRRVVLRDHKSRTRISIPITEKFEKTSKVKSSSKDPLSEQSLKALRNVRAALNECHQYEQPRFKASPSRSSDSTGEEKSWIWSDSSLEVETDSSSKSSEKPEKKSSSSSSEEAEESSSSSEKKSSSSFSEEEAEEEVVLGDKYKSFPREWLVSFQRDYPKTGLPVVPDKLEK